MLDWSIRLFRVFGIRLEMHISFLILPAYFGVAGMEKAGLKGVWWSLLFLVVIFACVVLHELGHSLTARRFGIKTSRILLMPIGGLAQFESMPDTPGKEALVTLAGPSVNFALFFALIPVTGPFSLERLVDLPLTIPQLVYMTMAFNLIMGVFNLLPVFPMDGGRLMRAVLSFWLPALRATEISSKFGVFAAACLAAFFLIGLNNLLLAALFLFIMLASRMELKAMKQRELFQSFHVRDFVDTRMENLRPESSIRDALGVLNQMSPRDLIITEYGRAVGLVELDELNKARKANGESTSSHLLAGIMQRSFVTLQANDTMEDALRLAASDKQSVFPVYDYVQLVGVLDAEGLDRRAYWKKAEKELD